jgi:threonine dehydrogenase-like Zn-dependent dehydrogenase
MIEEGALRPSSIITHSLPIDDAPAAYRAFDAREATKVVLTT